MPFCNAIYALLQCKRAPLTFQRGKVLTTDYELSILKSKTNETYKTSLNYGNNLLIREFGIRKGLKKLVISSKIRIFIGENQ